MFRRKFLASLAGVAGGLSFVRLSRGSSLPRVAPAKVNPFFDQPDLALGLPADELDGLSPQQAFMAGVEWKIFCNQLDFNPGEFQFLVHPANVSRCLKAAQDDGNSGRTARVAALGEHSWAAPYERDWRVIEVGAHPWRTYPK